MKTVCHFKAVEGFSMPVLYVADMINMFRLDFIPSCCVWLYSGSAVTPAVAWWAAYYWDHTPSHCATPTDPVVSRISQWCMSLIVEGRTRKWQIWTSCTPRTLYSWRYDQSRPRTIGRLSVLFSATIWNCVGCVPNLWVQYLLWLTSNMWTSDVGLVY